MARRIQLLHLEDDPRDAELIRLSLAAEGLLCDIRWVDGRAAFESALERDTFDLVLSDYVLPDYDGMSALRRVRELRPELPVIVISGTLGEEEAVDCLKAGATDYVLKHRLQRLGAVVRRALAEKAEHEQRLAAEGALRESEARLRTIVENLAEGVVVADLDGRVLEFNRAAIAMHAFTSREEYLRTLPEFSDTFQLATMDGAMLPLEQWPLARILRGETLRDVDLVVRRVRGDWQRIFSYGGTQLPGADSRPTLAVVTVRDITDRQRARQQILDLNASLERRVAERTRELDQANRAKSEFLATMSHEIRTPMNGVIGMVDVLHQTSLRGYQVEMVDLIRESAYSLLSIIDDILDFSKIEAGKLEIDSAPVDVAAVVKATCGMLEHMAARKGVELTLYADPAIPVAVLGDAGRLRQILVNLVSNAIKFSSGGERQGRVSMRALLAEPGDEQVVVEFRVADNGIGMTETVVARLFTPFTQADASTTRQYGGTGLGLTIARHLVNLMGGSISVESEPDRGSTFSVRIPLQRAQTEIAPQEVPSAVAGLSCVVVGGAGGMSDDLASYLNHAGADVKRAPDLESARAAIDLQPPGPAVWVIDSQDDAPKLEELRAAARPDAGDSILVIGRGQSRVPRTEAPDLVTIDGNALTRRTFLNTVALAAGRAELDDTLISVGRGESEFQPPERLQAARTGRLILVAEDNETNQQVIWRQLAVLGFAADIVSDGREALEHWESGSHALVLTDLHMPRMDGYDLTRAIRLAEAGRPRIPIIALTANALRGEADRCRAAGMDDYLSKPAPLSELKAALEKWLPATGDTGPQQQGMAAAAGDSRVPVEPSVLAALVGDDPGAQRKILEMFRSSLPVIAGDLRDACNAGDMALASAAAHTLKSSARSIGALRLGDLCGEIEKAGRLGDVAKLTELLPSFEAESTAVQAHLDAR